MVEKGEDYVLCVVKFSSDKLAKENIEKCTVLIRDVGNAIIGITQPSEYVEPDVNGYWIKSALWEKQGMTIDDWIKNVKDELKSET